MKEEIQRDEKIAKVASDIRQATVMYIELGFSPGEIAGGLVRVVYDLMKAQGMSEMECSNNLYTLVDGIREQAFEKKPVAH